uniref:Fc fragment of IgE receptor Ig n=1 Tax=Gopherus agassizii TaxID=38772 RepID=A0A452GWW7_9SAUR
MTPRVIPFFITLMTPLLPAEALAEPELCYVLDAVLFTYGIILTVLYCRLKVSLQGPGRSHHSLSDPRWGAEGYCACPSTPETP